MRCLQKLSKPEVLANNEVNWLEEFLADPINNTKKTRYRDPEIKGQLIKETSNKCVYCESKIGHNTPGDTEHKVPTSIDPNRHFEWENLTIACSECNRRKNNYYEPDTSFIDPYVDDVEQMLEHYGPLVGWRNGDVRAEVSVRILQLNSELRSELVARKFGKYNELANAIERYNTEADPTLKRILKQQVIHMADISSEYSAMISSILQAKEFV